MVGHRRRKDAERQRGLLGSVDTARQESDALVAVAKRHRVDVAKLRTIANEMASIAVYGAIGHLAAPPSKETWPWASTLFVPTVGSAFRLLVITHILSPDCQVGHSAVAQCLRDPLILMGLFILILFM